MKSKGTPVTRLIERAGFQIHKSLRLPNDTGWQFVLLGGGIVNAFDTGRFSYQGTLPAHHEAALRAALEPQLSSPRHVVAS